MRIPMGWQKWLLIVLAGASVWALLEVALPSKTTRASGPSTYVTTGVFTPAHPTATAAIKDFLDIHPEHPVQPIAYTHIKKIAAYKARGEEIPWVRVYNYSESAHVRFNHAPHIRAGVDCAMCHSDLTKQTTAERKVNLNMGFCINCHTQKKVSIDCETCHY
jgi:hypothetical protein